MIVGNGIDSVSINRIKDLAQKFQEKFQQRIFSQNEIVTAQKILPEKRDFFYAKRFAAKEAFSKAIGLGIGRGIDFVDIEVENNDLGKPFINILNGKKEFLLKKFNCKDLVIHLSLTDEGDLASAFVIIEKIS